MTFYRWMTLQVGRKDDVGELARAMVKDTQASGVDVQSAEEWRTRIRALADWEPFALAYAEDEYDIAVGQRNA